jgi:diguanylate cyclase (GGDEF)-like protein
VTLCVFDVDDFKRVNDSFGHPAGDEVLRGVARCLRQGGEAFRLGGDEFALVLPETDAEAGAAVAATVLARLERLEFPHGGGVTFSAGLATCPLHAQERTELLRVADVALYTAKRAGRNQLRVAEPAPPSLAAVAAT